MPIHHSKQFFRNLACPLSELQPLGVQFFFFLWSQPKYLQIKEQKRLIKVILFLFFFTVYLLYMHHNICTMCAGFASPLILNLSTNTARQKLMRMQESLMIAFSLILGCLVHPFGVFA